MNREEERIRKLHRIANIYHRLLFKLEDYGMTFQESAESCLTAVSRDLLQRIAVADDELETIANVLNTISKNWKNEIDFFKENPDKIITDAAAAKEKKGLLSSPSSADLHHYDKKSASKTHSHRGKRVSEANYSVSAARTKMNMGQNVYYNGSLDPRF